MSQENNDIKQDGTIISLLERFNKTEQSIIVNIANEQKLTIEQALEALIKSSLYSFHYQRFFNT